MATLPLPALTRAGFNWVVHAGTREAGGLRGAFLFTDDAARYAKEYTTLGMRVAIGHTVFGWHDLADMRLEAAALGANLREWEKAFLDDPWHSARYARAVVGGKLD